MNYKYKLLINSILVIAAILLIGSWKIVLGIFLLFIAENIDKRIKTNV